MSSLEERVDRILSDGGEDNPLPSFEDYQILESLKRQAQAAETVQERKEYLSNWLEAYREWSDGETYPDYKYVTVEQVQLVMWSMEEGIIPDKRKDTAVRTPYESYFITVWTGYLDDCLDLTEEELEDKLHYHEEEWVNGWKGTSDGSAGQAATCNKYRTETVQWILGEHEDQEVEA